MKNRFLIAIMVAGSFMFSSCGSTMLTVSSRPEPPHYARPNSPGSGYVWIDGDWVSRGGRYQWREGHWRRSNNRVWYGGTWESRNGGYYWRRGYWK